MGGCCDKVGQHLKFEVENWQDVAGKPSFECISPHFYLVSRFVNFLLWVAVLVWTFIDSVVLRKQPVTVYLAFLTNMGNILLGVYFGLNVYVIAKAQHDKSASAAAATPLIVRITLAIGALFPALSILIAALFWILVYPTITSPVTILTVLNHGGNALFALEELFWSRRTLAPVQVYVFVFYGIYYSVFSYIYFLLGGTDGHGNPYLYTVINWNKPQSTVTILAAIVGLVVPALYFLGLGLAAFRDCASSKCRSQSDYKPISQDTELANKA